MRKNYLSLAAIAGVGSAIGIMCYYLNNYVGGCIFICMSLALFMLAKRIKGNILNFLGVFSLVWFFTIGLSCFMLHSSQTIWNIQTWLCLVMAYIMFCLGYAIKPSKNRDSHNKKFITKKNFVAFLATIFTLSLGGFIVESVIRGGIPLFSSDMASYADFGVTGIHYFTVSSCLFLPASIIYLKFFHKEMRKIDYLIIIIANIIMLAIPIAIVSRQLLIATVIISSIVFLTLFPKYTVATIIIVTAAMSAGWIFITTQRNQTDEYLQSALAIYGDEFTDDDKAILTNTRLMQVYMYLACNYDNLNENIGNIDEYTFGKRTFFPVIALTGLKYATPSLGEMPNLSRFIPVFNTYPIIMAPYADFGIVGVAVYMLLIGMICGYLDMDIDRLRKRPITILIRAIFMYAIIFSFFSNWFANPTTVFYVLLLYILCRFFFSSKVLTISNSAKGENVS
ncbi:oligosaccharide repeat unit polymerase [Candidatus Saccharibacteria bacterium]|nr:oligosaccharide repeat unit polymerase [Candidatus Saccharibacteria bacterium]